jgi:peptidoglycan hydrolase-like protein with peptidoglycan-binding domain
MPAAREDVMVRPPAGDPSPGDPAGDAGRTLAFHRSLRASRSRRAAAALRRRRVLRSRGSAFVAAAGMLVATAGAVAQQQDGSPGGSLSSATIAAAQRALGVEADGVVGPQTRRAARRFQRTRGLIADGVIGSQTLKALGVGGAERIADAAASTAGSALDRIAACESGGDPTAISADGQYHGKYQFSLATWRQVGGSGDPADAPEAEQDRRAAMLLDQAGPGSWPSCG